MEKLVRLDKVLADAGKGTRSEVKKEIKKGLVLVNGTTVKSPEQKISPGTDLVLLRGEPVLQEPEFAYYLLYKPAGWISATEDRREKTVMELVPSGRKGLFPVGRLDKDTEGLLLITTMECWPTSFFLRQGMWRKLILSESAGQYLKKTGSGWSRALISERTG